MTAFPETRRAWRRLKAAIKDCWDAYTTQCEVRANIYSRRMTPEEERQFDAAFAKFDEAFDEFDKVFKTMRHNHTGA